MPQHRSGLSAAAQPDGGGLAELVGGGVVRAAPVACGIGGLGGGAEDVLSTFFGLLALLFYARYAQVCNR